VKTKPSATLALAIARDFGGAAEWITAAEKLEKENQPVRSLSPGFPWYCWQKTSLRRARRDFIFAAPRQRFDVDARDKAGA